MQNDIYMPRLGVNDDTVTLVRWLVNSGDFVKKNQKIAEIESTKESSEIVSEVEGHISCLISEGEDVFVGVKIASIGDAVEEKNMKENNDFFSDYKITEKAKRLVLDNKIDISVFSKNKLIKEKDILNLISASYAVSEVKTNKVLIYGGGGMSKVVIDILKTNMQYDIGGIIDIHYPDKKEVMGISVIGNDSDLEKYISNGYNKIINTIGFKGNRHWRKQPYEMLKTFGYEFPNIFHKSVIVEPSAKFGEGNIILAGAIIGSEVVIGSNCIINAGSNISHGCIISDNCHIASGAVLSGDVVIGENSLIGQNVTIYMKVKIGQNVVIKNGCNIFHDVKDNQIIGEDW